MHTNEIAFRSALRAIQKQREYVRVLPRGKWHIMSPHDMHTICGIEIVWGKIQAVSRALDLRICPTCFGSIEKLRYWSPKNRRRAGYYEMYERV